MSSAKQTDQTLDELRQEHESEKDEDNGV